MVNTDRFQCQQMNDSAWVPRDTYEKIMRKLDALNIENNELKAENRRLREACEKHASLGRLPIGS